MNAIEENIQQRLNGYDYDSDIILVTNDELLIEVADKYKDFFKVTVCNLQTSQETSQTIFDLDNNTSKIKIEEIVNLSLRLNNIKLNEIYSGASAEEVLGIYEDV